MFSIRLGLILPVMLGLHLAGVCGAKADLINLDASADTFIDGSGSNGGSTHGSEDQLFVGNSIRSSGGFYSSAYILVRWDLSAYAGRTVSGDGSFSLNQIAGGPNITLGIEAHEILAAWDQANVSYSSFNASQVSGFGPSVADDTVSTALVDGSVPGPVSWTLSRDLIQSWIDSPSANNGLFLALGGESFFAFQSLEAGAAPQLAFTLNPSAVPEPSSFAMLGIGGLGLLVYGHRRWIGRA